MQHRTKDTYLQEDYPPIRDPRLQKADVHHVRSLFAFRLGFDPHRYRIALEEYGVKLVFDLGWLRAAPQWVCPSIQTDPTLDAKYRNDLEVFIAETSCESLNLHGEVTPLGRFMAAVDELSEDLAAADTAYFLFGRTAGFALDVVPVDELRTNSPPVREALHWAKQTGILKTELKRLDVETHGTGLWMQIHEMVDRCQAKLETKVFGRPQIEVY